MELRHTIIGILFAGALIAAGGASAGDDDKAPAYRIYIDPETGRYTTEDPLAGPADSQSVVAMQPQPVSREQPGQSTAALLSIAALLALLAGGVLLYRRQPTS